MRSMSSNAQHSKSAGPDVTIIIPVYNTEAFIRDCLTSVQAQTLTNFEALIIDDASPDGATSIATEFSLTDSRFRIIRHERNRGLPAARNTGEREARGRYLYHLDSDDLITSSALERVVTQADRDNADITVFNSVYFPGCTEPKKRVREMRRNIKFTDEPSLWSGGSLFLFLFSRPFIIKMGAFHDEELQIVEDEIYLSKVLPQAERISMITDTLHFYRRGHSSISQLGTTWPFEKWIDYFGYPGYVSKHLRNFPAALYYNLCGNLSTNASLLVCAMEQLDESLFRQVLCRFAAAYEAIDPAIACMPSAQPWPQKIMIPVYFHKLVILLARGDIAAAERELRSLRAKYIDTTILKSRLSYKSANSALALEMARAAISQRPDIAASYHQLALLEAKSGNFKEAEEAEGRALDLDPEYADSHFHIGELLFRRGEIQGARAQITKALDINPYPAAWHARLGSILERMEQWEEAAAAYEAALASDGRAAWHARLGKVLERMEQWKKAAAAYEAALSRDGRAAWHVKLGRVREKMEQWEKAAATYQAALAHDESHAEWHARLARVWEKMKQWKLSAAEYEAALARDDSRAEWQAGLARVRERWSSESRRRAMRQ